MANMECSLLMITDPASHHDTPSSHCDNVLHTYATLATVYQHSFNENVICQRIANHANIIISMDNTFLPHVCAHLDGDQSGQVQRKVGELAAQQSEDNGAQSLH